MIHLLFLLASLGLVIVGQQLALVALRRLQGWNLRRWVQILALAMPFSVMVLFSLTMIPGMFVPETEHYTDHEMHREWLISIAGLAVFVTPILVALLFNSIKLIWLYRRTLGHTWEAPAGLEELIKGSFATAQIRLWYSPRPFAFNLPALWPGAKSIVVLSTSMLTQLDTEEIRAVLWHEGAHLAQRDFWIIWLANWWRTAFFYLPTNGPIYRLLQQEQELACDDQVAHLGGQALALALADALLKIWENMLADSRKSFGFRAPGLASQNKIETGLTEQRVNRLLELESSRVSRSAKTSFQIRLRTGGGLAGSVGLWLVMLEMMHLLMMPMGCAITLGL